MRSRRKWFWGALFCAALLACAQAAAGAPRNPFANLGAMKSYFVDKRIGYVEGSAFEEVCKKTFPRALRVSFESEKAMTEGLLAGKIEGYLTTLPSAQMTVAAEKKLWLPPVVVKKDNYAWALSRSNEKLISRINAALRRIEKEGGMEKLQARWLNGDISARTVPDYDLNGRRGKFRVVTDGDSAPFIFLRDGKMLGYEVELLMNVAKALDYDVEFEVMSLADLVPAVVSGRCDVAMACLSVTNGRRKQIRFTEPIFEGGVVMVVHEGVKPLESGK